MTDVVTLARIRREEMRAEVEALNRFVGTAEWLLRSERKPVQIAAAADTSTPSTIERPQAQIAAQARSSEAQPSEWTMDTFHFEQMATGAA